MGTKHSEINTRFAEKIELKPVGWLKPYARNARTHSSDQLDQIAASIAEFGFVNPILAKSDGTVIAGHGRLEASTTRLGMADVPVIILDHLSDQQARMLVLADNKIAMNAGWDEELLAEELADMEAEGLTLSLSGFDDEELDDILGRVDELNEMPPMESAGKSEFQQLTFTVHNDQAAIIRAALRGAIDAGAFRDGLNENSNGNALARICSYYNEGYRENGKDPAPEKKTAVKKPAAKKQPAKKGKAGKK